MDSIKTEVMQIKQKIGIQDQLHMNSSISSASFRSPPTGKNSTMVGFDEVFDKVMDKLIGQQSNLQIIPIVGMGGIGKTTLARNIYQNPLIVQHFHVFAWVTISQEYSVREILLELLCYLEKKESKENFSQLDEFKLGEKLHKRLSGWRYLIIVDDIWSIDVWNEVRIFFPDNNSGSRIMITTRLSNLAFQLSGSQFHGFQLSFLDENKSWNLLCQNVFGKESCPIELEEIGMIIARNCKGLPLSIAVIAGLLAKSKRTREYWEYIAENLNSIVNSEDDKLCLQILYMSYHQLPVHLKPCFLYIGVFPEDKKVRVSELIKLWVAEGFLKPIGGKTLEDVAEEYLEELIDRNLILVHKWGSSGKIKLCKIHDLLRDLCLREAHKQKFLGLIMQWKGLISSPGRIIRRSRIVRTMSVKKYHSRVSHAPRDAARARCLIWDFGAWRHESFDAQLTDNKHFQDGIFKLFSLRHLSCPNRELGVPSSIYRFWNLHTLIARGTSATASPEIWKMALLRHVEFAEIYLPDPPSGHTKDDFVLGNLQTISRIKVWDCRRKVVERIPNIKKLKICLGEFERWAIHFLNNLGRLHKLESLHCLFLDKGIRSELLQSLVFPYSLKKLTLCGSNLQWEDMTTKIGSLPLLQVLKLKWHSFTGPEWETVEEQFRSLKFLLIEGCPDLKYWKTDSTHFPRLEHLELRCLKELKEIPSDIGEIPTLRSIELVNCSYSTVISAKRILVEQEELGNEGLRVRVKVDKYDKVVQSLASQNFQVEIWQRESSLDARLLGVE